MKNAVEFLTGGLPSMEKAVATVTVACFLLSCVCGQALQASIAVPGAGTPEQPAGLLLPSSFGKITDARFYGSGKVVIGIQDLHCHTEVQKNISRILSILDGKYGLDRVFVEGAVGEVDTSWLSSIRNGKTRDEVVQSLLGQGRLSGAEYYSVLARKPRLLTGIEDEKLYLGNIRRLAGILARKDEMQARLAELTECITSLKKTYYSRRHRKFAAAVERYDGQSLDTAKFYRLAEKYSRDLGVDLSAYKNITNYRRQMRLQRSLDYENISGQLAKLMAHLKSRLPYTSYRELSGKLGDPSRLDEFYDQLTRICGEYHVDLGNRFPHLARFAEYFRVSRDTNPQQLVGEERRLLNELHALLCDSEAEREVTFLAEFFGYIGEYLGNAISAEDYSFYTGNLAKFKRLWAKYAVARALPFLTPYEELLGEFYRVNIERNDHFLASIMGDVPVDWEEARLATTDDQTAAVLSSIKNGNDIAVVVTGGFHTAGLSEMMKERRISYLVITPNVTDDPLTAGGNYASFAREEGKILTQTTALYLLSELPIDDRLCLSAEALAAQRSLSGILRTKDDGAHSKVFAASIEQTIKEIVAACGGDAADISFRYVDRSPDGTRFYVLQRGGKTFRFRVTDGAPARAELVDAFTVVPADGAVRRQGGLSKYMKMAADYLAAGGVDGRHSATRLPADAAALSDEIARAVVDLGACFHYDAQGRPHFDAAATSAFLEKYSQDVAEKADYPVEAAWPVLKAIVQLDKAEEEVLIDFIMQRYRGRHRPVLVDAILLMNRMILPGWLGEQAPELSGRKVYYVSAENTHWAGGLGPVMTFHGRGMHELGADVAYIEPWYQLRTDKGNRAGDPLDYGELGVRDVRDVLEYTVEVGDRNEFLGRNLVKVKVGFGVNEAGIGVYLIRDVQPDGSSYYTKMLYNYGNRPYNDATWEDFTSFFCVATAELIKRLELSRHAEQGVAWKPPVVHTNDGQTAPLAAVMKSRFGEHPALSRIVYAFTTHTYRNRGFAPPRWGKHVLGRMMGIADRYLPAFMRFDWETDYTSGGIRLSNWSGAVSRKHRDDVEKLDPPPLSHGVAVTNGATPDMMARAFREQLEEMYPGVDVERPAPGQVQAAKKACKEALNGLDARTSTGRTVRVDPERILISYCRRLVPEKAGRERAFTDENVLAMVKAGAVIALFGNQQASRESADLVEQFRMLEERVIALKAGHPGEYPGEFFFVPAFTPRHKMGILAASDVQVQDSDEHTGAAEFSEEDITANAGLQFSPPYSEGVIMAQGLPLDLDDPLSRGNTIVPTGRTPSDYLDAFQKTIRLWQTDNVRFYENGALSVRINRIQQYLLTSATYLREYARTLQRIERENRLDREALATVRRSIAGAGNPQQVAEQVLYDGRNGVARFKFDIPAYFVVPGWQTVSLSADVDGLEGFIRKKIELEKIYGYEDLLRHLTDRGFMAPATDYSKGDYAKYLSGLFAGLPAAEEAVADWFDAMNASPAAVAEKNERFNRFVLEMVRMLKDELYRGMTPGIVKMESMALRRESAYYGKESLAAGGRALEAGSREECARFGQYLLDCGRADRYAIGVHGRTVSCIVDKSLMLTGAQIGALMEEALARAKGDVNRLPDTFVFAVLRRSTHLFEDQLSNGFIGVNRAVGKIGLLSLRDLLRPWNLRARMRKGAEARKIVRATGIFHELCHEVTGKSGAAFEREQMLRDDEFLAALLQDARISVTELAREIGRIVAPGALNIIESPGTVVEKAPIGSPKYTLKRELARMKKAIAGIISRLDPRRIVSGAAVASAVEKKMAGKRPAAALVPGLAGKNYFLCSTVYDRGVVDKAAALAGSGVNVLVIAPLPAERNGISLVPMSRDVYGKADNGSEFLDLWTQQNRNEAPRILFYESDSGSSLPWMPLAALRKLWEDDRLKARLGVNPRGFAIDVIETENVFVNHAALSGSDLRFAHALNGTAYLYSGEQIDGSADVPAGIDLSGLGDALSEGKVNLGVLRCRFFDATVDERTGIAGKLQLAGSVARKKSEKRRQRIEPLASQTVDLSAWKGGRRQLVSRLVSLMQEQNDVFDTFVFSSLPRLSAAQWNELVAGARAAGMKVFAEYALSDMAQGREVEDLLVQAVRQGVHGVRLDVRRFADAQSAGRLQDLIKNVKRDVTKNNAEAVVAVAPPVMPLLRQNVEQLCRDLEIRRVLCRLPGQAIGDEVRGAWPETRLKVVSYNGSAGVVEQEYVFEAKDKDALKAALKEDFDRLRKSEAAMLGFASEMRTASPVGRMAFDISDYFDCLVKESVRWLEEGQTPGERFALARERALALNAEEIPPFDPYIAGETVKILGAYEKGSSDPLTMTSIVADVAQLAGRLKGHAVPAYMKNHVTLAIEAASAADKQKYASQAVGYLRGVLERQALNRFYKDAALLSPDADADQRDKYEMYGWALAQAMIETGEAVYSPVNGDNGVPFYAALMARAVSRDPDDEFERSLLAVKERAQAMAEQNSPAGEIGTAISGDINLLWSMIRKRDSSSPSPIALADFLLILDLYADKKDLSFKDKIENQLAPVKSTLYKALTGAA